MATAIGIAWYEPSDWTKLRAIAPDVETLENTHGEWLALPRRVCATCASPVTRRNAFP